MEGKIHALTLNGDRPIVLKGKPELLLKIGMLYEIVRTQERTERGVWRVSTRGYKMQSPHAHLGHTQLAPDAVLSYKAHHPTGRISLESVIRLEPGA